MAKLSAALIVLFCVFSLSVARSTPRDDAAAAASITPITTGTDDRSAAAAVTSMPLTKFTFRPVNRRFPVRSRHPCRHHFKVTYGNDMILSSSENSDFVDPVRHGQGRWVRLRPYNHALHHRGEGSETHGDRIKEIVFKRHDFDLLDMRSFKDLGKMVKRYRAEQEKTEKHGMLKGVREFVNRYFPNVFA